jgi:uncharacterized membrane protein
LAGWLGTLRPSTGSALSLAQRARWGREGLVERPAVPVRFSLPRHLLLVELTHVRLVDQVHGSPFDAQEREVLELTRKVTNLALIFVFLAVVSCMQEMQQGRTTDALWWLMVSLAMPYCGYYGAKNKDRNLLCMFYSINLAIAIMYVLTVLLIFVFIQAIDPAVQECHDHQSEGTFEEDVRLADPEADQSNDRGGGANEGQQMNQQQCDYWETAQTHKADMYMQVIIYSCQIFLNCSAFSNGKRLATLPYFGAAVGAERYGDPVAERAAQRQRLRERAQQRRQQNVVHAQVIQAVAVPVIVPPPTHPQLRPGEVQAGAVFEVETTQNPAMGTPVGTGSGGGGGGTPLMGTVVMGEPVFDDVEDPECPTSQSPAARRLAASHATRF